MSIWLQRLGAVVRGYALDPSAQDGVFVVTASDKDMEHVTGDIRDYDALVANIKDFCPEVVIHMAAQPLVRESYSSSRTTFETNVMGTVNVLEAIKQVDSVRAVVNVTSDKCYQNREWYWGYRENEAMGGHDPYSASKGCAELVSASYASSFFDETESCNLASARAGNVIGGGDRAQDRLVPDGIKAFKNHKPLVIRNPLATRPWQHVLEPLSGYLQLAENLAVNGAAFTGGWNFGPLETDNATVSTIASKLTEFWGNGAKWLVHQSDEMHEAQLLKLDISKAMRELHWRPRWNYERALAETVEWESALMANNDMRAVSIKQIESYMTCGD